MGNPTTRRALRRADALRLRLQRIAAVAITAVALLAGSLVVSQPAMAASLGAGYGDSGDWRGAYTVGSMKVYCLEPGIAAPMGTSEDRGYVSTLNARSSAGGTNAMTANQLARVNYLVTTYGQTENNNQAAAVHFAVQYTANRPGMFASSGYSGPNNLDDFIAYKMSPFGQSVVNNVTNRASQYVAEAANITAGPVTGGSGALQFTVDGGNNYLGTVRMVGTPGSTGTIVLTNGIFLATGTSTLAGATQGTSYQVRGVPPADGSPYKISGTGTFTAPGGGWAGNIRYFRTGTAQKTAGPGQRTVMQFNVSGFDPTVRGVQFVPVVQTTATRYVQPGQPFTDSLQFSAAADSEGTTNSWFRSNAGNYAPVTATGTVYGPFASQPEESDDVPEDAPVAGTATVTTSLQSGPTVTYTAATSTTAAAGGFYTWVWVIDWHDQDPGTQRVVPGPSVGNEDQEPYYFQDRFGQVAETHIVPTGFTAVSEINAPELPLSGTTNDTITVTTPGAWVQVDGQNIPVVWRGTAYFVPGTTPPAQQPANEQFPDGTVELGSRTLTVTGPGSYTPEDGIEAPDHGVGYITWVWRVISADQDPQYRGMILEWADEFGIPSETQMLLQPEVTTLAQQTAAAGVGFTDTAEVAGTLPVGGADLHFELFAATQNDDGQWVCDSDSLLWVSDAQHVDELGSYTSPVSPGQVPGDYHWVEVLTGKNGGVIHRGECGIENETTRVAPPTAVTDAQPGAKLGGQASDTATVTGTLPTDGARLQFTAYQVPMMQTIDGAWAVDAPVTIAAADDMSWVCTDENLAFTDPGVLIFEAGSYRSASFTTVEHGKYIWQETLIWDKPVLDVNGDPVLDGDGQPQTVPVVLHQDECGLAFETAFVVDVNTKAFTSDGSGPAAFGEYMWDTAELIGYMPEGGSMNFEVYQSKKGAAPVCAADNLLATLPSDAPVVGGLYTADAPLKVTSKRWKNQVDYDSDVYFVEVTTDSEGREVSRGVCGDPDETVQANAAAAAVARTGNPAAPVVLIFGFLATAAGFGLASVMLFRAARRRVS